MRRGYNALQRQGSGGGEGVEVGGGRRVRPILCFWPLSLTAVLNRQRLLAPDQLVKQEVIYHGATRRSPH